MNYLDNNNLDKVSLFGYSMGGYVAMYVALNYQERFEFHRLLPSLLNFIGINQQQKKKLK